ncbi:MAG: TonB-dependent receptor plug domain-containing protein [Pseudomonadota bacterium]
MPWRRPAAPVLGLAMLGALPVHAQTTVATAGAALPEVRISASLLPQTEASASQHVTVLTRADLDALGDLSVADVLSRQAGIVTDRSARSGGFGSLFLRGADPSHVVVLVDHVRQNDPLSSRGSAVDLNTLPAAGIERIEIVRGNVSVVHGEALAGLVHIFTRAAAPRASLGIGSGGLRSAQAAVGSGEWRAQAGWREDGDGTRGFTRTRSAGLSWRTELERGSTLAVWARAADSFNLASPDDSGGEQFAVLPGLESRRAGTRQLAARGAFNLPQAGRLELQASTFARNGDDSTPGVAPGLRDPAGLPRLSDSSRLRRHALQALWLPPTSGAWLVTLGVHHQRESGQLDSLIDFGGFSLPAGFSRSRGVTSLMAEARWQHGDWTLQGGLRHEMPSDGENLTHPMLSLRHELGAGLHWGAAFSSAAKLPSFYALGHPLVGNPALRTERAVQREVYLANADSAAWPTRLTLFSARYRDLVDFDAGPPPMLVNRARIQADGLEWRTRHDAGAWRLQFEGALMRVRDPDGDTTLRHRPHAQLSAQLQLPFGARRDVTLMAKHVGRRFDSSIPTGDQWLAPLTTLDLSARLPLGAAQATVAVDNLLDTRRPETIGTPAPSRRLRVALTWPLS